MVFNFDDFGNTAPKGTEIEISKIWLVSLSVRSFVYPQIFLEKIKFI